MARTLLDIDRDLLEQAKAILGEQTFTATVNEALRRVVAVRAQQQLIDWVTEMDDEQHEVLATARDRAW
jgi:Arc/MetJ family transcription regulator